MGRRKRPLPPSPSPSPSPSASSVVSSEGMKGPTPDPSELTLVSPVSSMRSCVTSSSIFSTAPGVSIMGPPRKVAKPWE